MTFWTYPLTTKTHFILVLTNSGLTHFELEAAAAYLLRYIPTLWYAWAPQQQYRSSILVFTIVLNLVKLVNFIFLCFRFLWSNDFTFWGRNCEWNVNCYLLSYSVGRRWWTMLAHYRDSLCLNFDELLFQIYIFPIWVHVSSFASMLGIVV